MKYPLQSSRIYADFNGLFGDLLCLSHSGTCQNEAGEEVTLQEGMIVTAYDDDSDFDGNRDNILATGMVIPSPPDLACLGSRWALQIDENGIRSESEIPKTWCD